MAGHQHHEVAVCADDALKPTGARADVVGTYAVRLHDGTSCTVSEARYAEIAVGYVVWCLWVEEETK